MNVRRGGEQWPYPPEGETGAPDQCAFLICARARRCQQPTNCLAGVVPLTPQYQPLYKAARERDDAQ